MSLLTPAGVQKYALATGKIFVGVCDEKNCGRLIPTNELYTVLKWKPRPDKLNFLGMRPAKIRCKRCQDKKNPIPVVKKKTVADKSNGKIRKAVLKLFTKHPKTALSTKMLVGKLKHKKALSTFKHREFTKVFKELKKEKILVYKEKIWRLK